MRPMQNERRRSTEAVDVTGEQRALAGGAQPGRAADPRRPLARHSRGTRVGAARLPRPARGRGDRCTGAAQGGAAGPRPRAAARGADARARCVVALTHALLARRFWAAIAPRLIPYYY